MCFIKWWSAQKTSLICCCCCSISCKLLKVHWFDLVTAACEGWHSYTLLKRLSKFCPQMYHFFLTWQLYPWWLIRWIKCPLSAILLDIFFRSRVVPLDDKRQRFFFPACLISQFFSFGLTWILASQADFRKLILVI